MKNKVWQYEDGTPGYGYGQMIFLTQTDTTKNGYKKHVDSFDEIEATTGLDLFKDLPKEKAVDLESRSDLNHWRKGKRK